MLVHRDVAASQRPSPWHLLDLQPQVLKADRVVAVHRALKLQREDQIQVLAAGTRHERAPALCRRHLKAAVELADILLPQKSVGLVQGRDPLQPQFLRQPALPGAEAALAAAPGLRRVSRDQLHSQLAQGSSHLRQTVRIHFASHLGVSQKWLPRSLYRAQNSPLRSITSRNPAMTVAVDSSSTSCA